MKTPLILILGGIFLTILPGILLLERNVVVLSIPLLVYLFAAILQRPEAVMLKISRKVTPDYAPQGSPVSVTLTITNQGAAMDELTIQDILPGGIQQLEGDSSQVTSLDANGTAELAYTIAARRGAYDSYEVLVRVRDFSGCFELPLVYRAASHLIVHPHYPKLDRVKLRPPQTRGFAGPIAARQGGTGIDFWGVREYQSSDAQRHINWKLAARRDNQELYTNVFEQERVADVGLILDARQRVNVITATGSLFEHSVQAAAALADNFLDDGNRVSLLIYGSALVRVFPGYGRHQRERIIKALSRANPGMNYALESLGSLPTRLFPPKSQIILVSPLSPDDISAIVTIRARGYAVMIISPDPISYESATHEDFSSPAYRMAIAERNFMLLQLRRSGVQVVNWRVDQPLEMVVRNMLARQPSALHITRLGL